MKNTCSCHQEYIICVDPVTQLGLNTDSVMEYSIADIHRASDADTPELLPCGYLVGESDTISVKLKGTTIALLEVTSLEKNMTPHHWNALMTQVSDSFLMTEAFSLHLQTCLSIVRTVWRLRRSFRSQFCSDTSLSWRSTDESSFQGLLAQGRAF